MSNYITKDHASQIAHQMVATITAKITQKENALSQIIEDEYNKTVPNDVLEAFKKNPAFFKRASQAYLRGHGVDDGFSLRKSVCSAAEYRVNVQLEPETAKIVAKSLSEIKKLIEKRTQLKKQIQESLLSLKTYKRIEVNFPEAFELIPNRSPVNTVAVPIDDIRKQLKAIK